MYRSTYNTFSQLISGMIDAIHSSNVDWVKVILSQRRAMTTNITKRSKCKNETKFV